MLASLSAAPWEDAAACAARHRQAGLDAMLAHGLRGTGSQMQVRAGAAGADEAEARLTILRVEAAGGRLVDVARQ
jgi:hypothetical protein